MDCFIDDPLSKLIYHMYCVGLAHLGLYWTCRSQPR